jgi:alkylhydroperoxidase family enzyme
LTRAPREVADSDFVTLKKYFSDTEIVDLHLLISLANESQKEKI